MSNYVKRAKQQLPEIIDDIKKLVNMDSPTKNKRLTEQAMRVFVSRFKTLTGATEEWLEDEVFGDHVKLQVGKGSKQILILGHIDTVWTENETDQRPFSQTDEEMYGPGVFDMKAGLVQGMYAVQSLVQEVLLDDTQLVFLVNSEEEIGSPASRSVIEEEACKSKAVFVVEPAFGKDGALKTERKGVARFRLVIEGIPAHSGIEHHKGVSANEELAHQVLYLHQLTDYDKGTTVNVGAITGGTTFNVVSERAEADIDIRVKTQAEADRIIHLVNHLSPKLDGTKITVEGGMIRPPMEKDASEFLYGIAKDVAKNELGFDLQHASTGGASDGCFTAALGIPTLDGMGAVGKGAHALDEMVQINQIPVRTALLAHVIEKVIASD